MVTRHQERALRSACLNGGKVTLPGKQGPITVEVTLAYGGRADATITYPRGSWSRLNDWIASDMYLEIAERLDADLEDCS